MRRTLSATACTAALLLAPAPVVLLSGSAAAAPVTVVGMSQDEAVATLSEAGVPYVIVNRAGSTMQNCRVTAQRDRGYDVVVDYDWDAATGEWKKTETDVWRGLSLTVFCD